MKTVQLKGGKRIMLLEREKKRKCPICKRTGPIDWFIPTDVPCVKPDGKKIDIPAILAECCATIYLELA